MDPNDQRDYAEERYLRELCPECDYSPCISGGPRGGCAEPRSMNVIQVIAGGACAAGGLILLLVLVFWLLSACAPAAGG